MVGISHLTHLLLSLNTHCSVGPQLNFFPLKMCNERTVFYPVALGLNMLPRQAAWCLWGHLEWVELLGCLTAHDLSFVVCLFVIYLLDDSTVGSFMKELFWASAGFSSLAVMFQSLCFTCDKLVWLWELLLAPLTPVPVFWFNAPKYRAVL